MSRRLILSTFLAAAAAAQAAPRPAAADEPLRLGVVMWLRHDREQEDVLVPPVYSNHLPKSLTYETLVGADDTGRILPALATRWEADADRRRYVFHLRETARFHDGSACDAAAVKRYFESFLVRDRDRWIGAAEQIAGFDVLDAHTLAIRLRSRYALLCDLTLMNPMGIVGGAFGRGGPWPMVGTGPFAVADYSPMADTRFVRAATWDGEPPRVDGFAWTAIVAGADRDPVSTWALERGRVDAVIESWRPSIPRDLAQELVAAGKARLVRGPGSLVQLLCFNHGRAPFADRALRARVRDAIDRGALIAAAEHGFARPCTTLFAPELVDWPDAPTPAAAAEVAAAAVDAAARVDTATAELPVVASDPQQTWLAIELARQLRPRGIDLRIVQVTSTEFDRRVKAGEFDLYIARTWGAPYDPQATLRARFRAETKQTRSVFYADPALVPLIDRAQELEASPQRAAIYAEIQAKLDRDVAVVPLFVPDRIALLGPGVDGIALGPSIYGIDLTHLTRKDPR